MTNMIDIRPRYPIGNILWSYIHTISLIYSPVTIDCLKTIGKCMPCQVCIDHYYELMNKYPLDDYKQEEFGLFKWTVMIHNMVNRKLGKEEWSFERALDHWSIPADSPSFE